MKYTVFLLLFFACGGTPATEVAVANLPAVAPPPVYLDPAGKTIATRFLVPEGFERMDYPAESFGTYLQQQPLKPDGSKVYLFNGAEKLTQSVHAAVLDVDVEKRDLQQCADAIMRLRAEYFWEQKDYDAIHFNFVSGFNAEYKRWRKGERIRVRGNDVSWVPGESASTDYASFRKYLTMVFSFAGTASLVHELHPIALANIEVGDAFIRGGSPGHAVIVVDKVSHPQTGEIRVLLAQGYMPAQDIHVMVNPAFQDGNPWYSTSAMTEVVRTAEFTFGVGELRRF